MRGFRFAGVAAGLKSAGRDVALVVNDGPRFDAAAVFTANRVQAAPVRWSRQVLRSGRVRAVVLNSGGANACTGPAGFQDTHATAEHLAVADLMDDPVAGRDPQLLVQYFQFGRYLLMGSSRPGCLPATLQGIWNESLTPPKTVSIVDGGWSVGGMAKGAGMLAPSLATMLCVLTTDAVAAPSTLDAALRAATRVSFERLDSDGCLSTNDTVLLLASGASGVAPAPAAFAATVESACRDLAAQLMADAEGSTKDVAIEVTGAATEDDAVAVGRAVARNNLVKTALFGNDPNWGRIIAAVGNGVWVCRSGAAADDRSTVDLSGRAVTVTVDLHAGTAAATVFTNDLSHGYVHENSAYST